MAKARYRLSSFEIDTWSENQQFSDSNPTIFAIVDDPLTPDGTETHSPSPDFLLRVLDFSKFYDVGTNTMRNATQSEIDTFEPAEIDDNNQIAAVRATGSIDEAVPGSDKTRRLETKAISKTELSYTKAIRDGALLDVFLGYINALRAEHSLPSISPAQASNDLDAAGFSDPDTAQWANRYKSFIDKDD